MLILEAVIHLVLANNILFDLHNSSHHTQPYSITVKDRLRGRLSQDKKKDK